MKRILIIVENLPVPFDKRVWNEARSLTQAGYRVSVISPVGKQYTEPYERIEGIAVYRHPLPLEGSGAWGYAAEYASALFWEFVLSVKVLFRGGFDAIQACNPPDTLFIIGAFYRLFGKKFVFDHHDINPELYEAKFGRKDFFWKLMVLLEKLTFKTAHISLATNESYRQIAIHRGGKHPSKVYVVRSGPDVSRMKPVDPVVSLKEGKAFLVGYVGVMGKQEGIDLLLESIRYIKEEKKRNDIRYVMIGGGTELENLKNLAQRLGLADEVRFTGRIPDKDLIEYLSTADVCVNPDVANEMNDKSTMNKIMEYMALAKPIVQFDLTEGRYSAQGASLYAAKNDTKDFAEKILELLANPDLRRRMGQAGQRRVVEELSWQYSEKELLKAYAGLWQDVVSPAQLSAPR